MPVATLCRWGNSQGFRIPKEACEELGIRVGDTVEMSVDPVRRSVSFQVTSPAFRTYRRTKKASLEELMAGYDGPKVGSEWLGPDVGQEVTQ